MRFYIVCLLAASLLWATPASADCAIIPNGTTILAPETRPEGAIFYNADHKLFQGCVGTEWQILNISSAAGIGGTLSGPSGCANIGDLCADGTVFAGYHPITQERLFIPTTDQGITSQWKTTTGTNDIVTDSIWDGQANSDQVPNDVAFPAFKLCKDLVVGPHADWYLPSRVEIYYLWSVRTIVEAGGNITNFQNSYYWSSTERNVSNVWSQTFNTGDQDNDPKTSAFLVRCVRR